MHPHPCCSMCPCHQPTVVMVPTPNTTAVAFATTVAGALASGAYTLNVQHRDDPDDGTPAVALR